MCAAPNLLFPKMAKSAKIRVFRYYGARSHAASSRKNPTGKSGLPELVPLLSARSPALSLRLCHFPLTTSLGGLVAWLREFHLDSGDRGQHSWQQLLEGEHQFFFVTPAKNNFAHSAVFFWPTRPRGVVRSTSGASREILNMC